MEKQIKKLIKNNDFNELKTYFIFNNIKVNDIDNSEFNILMHAFEKKASNDILKFLLKEYENLNFEYENKVPLFEALVNNNYSIANALINHGANINFCNTERDNILLYLFKNDFLNKRKMNFIFENGIDINYEDCSKKRFLDYVIELNKFELVLSIFNFYMYNTSFIVKLLMMYSNKIFVQKKDFQDLIQNEKTRIQITKSMYLAAIDTSNIKLIDFILKIDDNSSIYHIDNNYGLLLRATENDDLPIVTYLLGKGINVNEANEYNETSIIVAARNGNDELVKLLIDSGADINKVGEFNYTALMFASSNGHLETVKLLMENGAKADVKNVNELTAYKLASLNGHNDVVKYFIQNKIMDTESNGRSPLLGAASRGDLEIVKYFHEQGASLSEVDIYDWTALMLASEKGHLDVIQYLVEQGVEVNYKSKNSGYTAFRVAYENKYYDLMNYLLEHGANIDEKDNEGSTALMSASVIGNVKAVEFLIEHGANVNEKDMYDWTALMLASEKGHFNVVKYLFEHGANVNYKSSNRGYTAFLNAFEDKDMEVISYLIEHGANINDKDIEGYNALMYASLSGDIDLVRFLVEHGIEINSTNNYYETALLIAVNHQKLDVAQYLIDHHAVVYIQNEEHGLMEYTISLEPQ